MNYQKTKNVKSLNKICYTKEIADKEQNTIKDIVKRVFGYDLEEVEFNGDKLRIVVEGKVYFKE